MTGYIQRLFDFWQLVVKKLAGPPKVNNKVRLNNDKWEILVVSRHPKRVNRERPGQMENYHDNWSTSFPFGRPGTPLGDDQKVPKKDQMFLSNLGVAIGAPSSDLPTTGRRAKASNHKTLISKF
jgi:hypothetical protein